MIMPNTNRSKQAGIVSIMVTLVIMLVISLIVISFARMSRREQRQALDRQLSTQAFYAAESGVNAAAHALRNEGYSSDRNTCSGPTSPTNLTIDNSLTLDSNSQVGVSCLLINRAPTILEYENVATESQVVPINSTGSAISQITIRWRDKDGRNNLSGCSASANFPPAGSWSNCDVGVLRVDLVPTAGNFSRDSLLNNTFTAFLYPSSSGGSSAMTFVSASGLNNQGVVTRTTCSGTPATCEMRITGPGLGGSNYYMRLRTLYGYSTVNLTAQDASNNNLQLVGAQAIVDATGKASDVLRRIQVRVPLLPTQNVPDFATQSSGSLCKRYMVLPNDILLGSGDGDVSDPSNPCSIN